MKLIKLTIKNVLAHADKTIEFPGAGVFGLGGPMGSGKTSILRCLRFALLGGAKAPVSQKWGTAGETASVELVVESRGTTYTIKRGVSNSNVTLSYGTEKLTGAREVTRWLEEHTELNSDIFSQVSFTRQGRLTDFITATPSVRLAALQAICGHARLETARDTFLGELTTTKEIQLQEPLEDTRDRVTRLEAEYAACPPVTREMMDEAARAEATAVQRVTDRQRLADALRVKEAERAKLAVLASTVERAEKDVQFHDASLAVAVVAHTAATDELKLVEAAAPVAQQVIAESDAYEKTSASRAATVAKIAQLKAKTENVDLPALEKMVADVTAVHAGKASTVVDSAKEIARAEQEIKAVKSGVCPTCGTTKICAADGGMTDIASLVAEKTLQIANLSAARDAAATEMKTIQGALDSAVKHIQQVRKDMAELDALEDALGPAANPPHTPEVVQAARASLSDLVRLRTTESSARRDMLAASDRLNDVRRVQQQVARAAAELQGVELRMNELQAELAGAGPADGLVEQVAQARATSTALSTAAMARQSAEVQLKNARDRLVQAEAVAAENAQSERRRKTLNDAVMLLHRDNLPTELLRYQIPEIVRAWNSTLSDFSIPLSVTVDEDVGLGIVDALTGESATLDDASGGQSTCMAVAFYLALHQVYPQCGLLVMDEPTYGMDEPAIIAFHQLLCNLNARAEALGMQVVCVTHEQALRQALTPIQAGL